MLTRNISAGLAQRVRTRPSALRLCSNASHPAAPAAVCSALLNSGKGASSGPSEAPNTKAKRARDMPRVAATAATAPPTPTPQSAPSASRPPPPPRDAAAPAPSSRQYAATNNVASVSASTSYTVIAPNALTFHRNHGPWHANASHLSVDISPHWGSVQLHGNYTIHGPAIVHHCSDSGCLEVQLLPGGMAEQATNVGEREPGGCCQEVVATMLTTDETFDEAAAAGASSRWHCAGSYGEQEQCPAMMLFGSHVQLEGSVAFAEDERSGAAGVQRAVCEHDGVQVLHVAQLQGDGEVLRLALGAMLSHPLNVHPRFERQC